MRRFASPRLSWYCLLNSQNRLLVCQPRTCVSCAPVDVASTVAIRNNAVGRSASTTPAHHQAVLQAVKKPQHECPALKRLADTLSTVSGDQPGAHHCPVCLREDE